jgi:hypothetical protein
MARNIFLDQLNNKELMGAFGAQEEDIMSEMSPIQQNRLADIPPSQPEPQQPLIPNETPQEQVFTMPKLADIIPPKPEQPEVPMLAEADTQQTPPSETPMSKSEALIAEYNKMLGRDQQALEDARSRDRMLKVGGSIGDALATYLNAKSQMNVMAPGVQVQQGAGLNKVADMFATAPEIQSDVAQRRQALMDQYKQLAAGEKSAADRNLKERQVAAYEAQTKAQARKSEASTTKEAEKEKQPSFEEKEKIKARVKEDIQVSKENRDLKKQLEPAIATVDDQIKNVKDALDLINKSKIAGTGPLDQYFAGATPEGQLLKKALGNISLDTLVQKFQGMSRAIDTETDRKFFQETQPSMGNFETTNKKMLGDILTRLESVKKRSQDKLKEIETQKAPEATQTSNLIRIKGPSGEEATMTEDKAQKYLSRPGYTRLE